MRSYDWSGSPLGDPADWPQGLRIVVRLMLNTGHPMFVFWGRDNACLYNDAYRQSIGSERHPSALGAPARDVWAEVWDIVGSQIEHVRSGRGATWHRDHLVPITRDGKREEVFWTYSYSPIDDDTASGGIGGVLVLVTETTSAVLAARELAFERDRFALLFDKSPTFMALLRGPEHRYELTNPSYNKLLGHRPLIGRTIAEAVPEAASQGFIQLLDRVYATGEAYVATGARFEVRLEPGGPLSEHFLDFVYQPFTDADGHCSGVFVEGVDTTERHRAQAALKRLNLSLEARVEERTRERDRVWQNSRDLLVVIGADGIFRAVSPAWTTVLGHQPREVVGRSILDFVHADDADFTRSGLKSAAGGGDLTNFENRYLHQNGAPRWISWHTSVEGDLVYAYGRDVTAEKQAADAVELSETRLRAIFENSYLFQGLLDLNGTLLHANKTSLRAIECEAEAVIGKPFWECPWFAGTPGMSDRIRNVVPLVAAGETMRQEIHVNLPVGGWRWFDFLLRPMRDAHGNVVAVIPEASELTERKQAEAALVQAQKMEAVGQLTGGIAHDFNNLLAGVAGNFEMLQRSIDEGRLDGLQRYVSSGQDAARRAAALTQRLLAFSRRQTLDAKPTDANRLIHGMADLIRRSVGPGIEVAVTDAAESWLIKVDPSQLENALLNLCINARDAMAPDGGKLTIETTNRRLDERAANERELPAGQYLALSVTDTGSGMAPEVVARAFDPFFTTKPLGQGTGLGLSMIYGFVRQSGGQVRIHSVFGMGTTVSLYLPRFTGGIETAAEPPKAETADQGASETILIVDDEPTIRLLLQEVLEDIGYRVMVASDGAAGLKILQSDRAIELLITDVGMPGMNGRQLADAARTTNPALKVLFVTGYAESSVISSGQLETGMAILTKPFVIAALGKKVREMIDS